jgi:mannose-6-phosphate isomerase-like protein (cupin superfamily)
MESLPGGSGWIATAIGPGTGSRHVQQRVFHLRRGRTPVQSTGSGEEVLYVAEGRARLESGPHVVEARRGTGLHVGEAQAFRLLNEGPADAIVVSVRPPPRQLEPVPTRQDPIGLLHEDDQQPLSAGDDRTFRLLVQSRHFTQFVGFIDRSRAPFHTHTYEEAIYVLDGDGIVHVESRHLPIRRGTSIFLPPGTPHCLENRSDGVLKILGVFSPPGSPAAKGDPSRSPGPGPRGPSNPTRTARRPPSPSA